MSSKCLFRNRLWLLNKILSLPCMLADASSFNSGTFVSVGILTLVFKVHWLPLVIINIRHIWLNSYRKSFNDADNEYLSSILHFM